MPNKRKSIDPWYGLPFSRRPSALSELGSGLIETFDQLRGRAYLRTLHAHGVALTVQSMDQLQSVPSGLAEKAAALFVIAQHGEWTIDFAEIRPFKSLKELSLGAFVNPVNIKELGKLQDLRRLSIEQTFSDPLDIGMFEKLAELSISGAVDLAIPSSGIECLRAVSLFQGRPNFRITELAPNLDYLRLQSIDISELQSLLSKENHAKVLKLYNIKHMEDLDFLSSCRSISHLIIERCHDLKSLGGLNQCPDLLELELRECKSLKEVTSIRENSKLSGLYVVNCGRLSSRDFSELQLSSSYFHPQ